MNLSIIILTYNSESTLPETLRRAQSLSTDIHIVDSYSEDNTEAVSRQHGTHFTQHKFEHYGAQRNWAIDHLPLTGNWELHLDADERLSHELIKEIQQKLPECPPEIEGFFLPRLTIFQGKELRRGGLYPNWHMRLFRRGKGRCEQRQYDQHFYISGHTEKLSSPLLDHQSLSLSQWTERHLRWADAEVQELQNKNTEGRLSPSLSGLPTEQKRALRGYYYRAPLLLRAFLLFFYRYVLRLGFLDGKRGLIYLFLHSCWYRFMVDAKILEQRFGSHQTDRD